MKVTAELNNLRISPRKVKLVADLIKGMDAMEAVDQLNVAIKKTSGYMQKLLLSAVANGENNFGLSRDNLFVLDVIVGAGPTLKRWMPKAYGRAGKILKRTSKIRIVLEERIEGKDRKSKEQMEKEKKERQKKMSDNIKKEEKKKDDDSKKEEKKEAKADKIAEGKKIDDKTKKTATGAKNWKSKIFQRKSM